MTVQAPGPYDQKPSTGLLGCVFVPVVIVAAFLAIGTVLTAVMLVFGGKKGPFAESLAVGVFSLAFSAGLTAFFITVARRLLAAMRGRDVPHLFPPMVGVVVGGVLGTVFVVVGIASVAGAFAGKGYVAGAGRGIGLGGVFLLYAWRQLRARATAKGVGAESLTAPTD